MSAAITDEKCPKESPWGHIDHVTKLCNGAWFVSTPGHGGIKLSARLNAKVPDYARAAGGWYEEDCEWAIVPLFLPEVVDTMRSAYANPKTPEDFMEDVRDCVRNWHPNIYCRATGESLESLEGRSHEYDRWLFANRNAANYVVVSAWGSSKTNPSVPAGMVGVYATMGGNRGEHWRTGIFKLVSAEKYQDRDRYGYVLAGDEQEWEQHPTI